MTSSKKALSGGLHQALLSDADDADGDGGVTGGAAAATTDGLSWRDAAAPPCIPELREGRSGVP